MKSKKTNNRSLVSKITARVMLVVLLLTSAMNFSGCSVAGTEDGVEYDVYILLDHLPSADFALEDNNKEYDINDVTFTIYYGWVSPRMPSDFSFKIYAFLGRGEYFLIKENEVKDPKDYELIYEKIFLNMIWKKTYKHSETITIPKEVFNFDGYFEEDIGDIMLLFVASEEINPEWFETGDLHNIYGHSFTCFYIYYERYGDTIVLTKK